MINLLFYIAKILLAYAIFKTFTFSISLFLIALLLIIRHYIYIYILGLEQVSGKDLYWLLDDVKNNSNIVGILFFKLIVGANYIKRSPFDKLYPRIVEASKKVKKLRCRLRYFLGEYCWEEDPTFDVKNQVIHVKEHIKNEDELAKIYEKLVIKRFKLDEPQWLITIVENYMEDETVCIIKLHHSFGDGLAIVAFMLTMADNYEVSAFHQIASIPLIKQIFGFILVPIIMPYILICLLFSKKQYNPIQKQLIDGQKRIAVSKDYRLEDIKKASKAYNATINDFLMSVFCITVSDYFHRKRNDMNQDKDKTIIESIKVCIPFSFRQLPKSLDLMKLNNNISLLFCDLPLVKSADINSNVALLQTKLVKQLMNKLKNSFIPFANYYGTELLLNIFPLKINDWTIKLVTKKCSLVFSNVPGPKSTIKYNGGDLKKLVFFAPCLGSVGTSVSMISCIDILKVGIRSDIASIENPTEFLNILQDNIENFIKHSLELKKDI